MDELDQILSALRDKQAGYVKSMGEVFNDALSNVDQMQAPTPQALPSETNPFGRMAAVFAASLADQLGAKGTLANTNATFAQQQEDRSRVTAANFARQEAFDHDKQMQRLGVLMKIGDAKAKVLESQGDIDKYEAQVKANATLADKARKLQEAFDLKKLGIEHQNKLEEINAAKKDTSEEVKQKALDREDKDILKFQNDLGLLYSKPGYTVKTPEEKAFRILGIPTGADKPSQINLSDKGVTAILGRAAATARTAGGPRLKQTALETYYETAKAAGRLGSNKSTTAERNTLFTLLRAVFKTPQEAQDWLNAHPVE